MLFCDENGISNNNTNRKKSSFFQRPGSENTNRDCCICGKKQEDDKLPHIWRYGGFVCSVDCFRALKDKQPKRVSNKVDISIVRDKLKRRRAMLKHLLKLSNERDAITKDMFDKGIDYSSAFYKGKWFHLKESDSMGFPGFYTWNFSTFGANLHKEYAAEYADVLWWMQYYEQELECLDKYLTSGKCVRYTIESGRKE